MSCFCTIFVSEKLRLFHTDIKECGMHLKKVIAAIFVLLYSGIIYGNEIVVNVTPYASGFIIIHYPFWHKSKDINKWYDDTISFSTGTKIAFMELNQMITRNYLAAGGMVLIDSISSMHYKFSEKSEKIYENWDPSNFYQGMYLTTVKNPDTNWNESMRYPDSLAPCDTFVAFNPGNPDSIVFIKSRSIYTINFSLGTYLWYTWEIENYNSICYLKDCNNNHFKVQIAELDTIQKNQGPLGTGVYPDTFIFFWAADSCGNGIFKHDPTANKTIQQTESETEMIFISKQNGRPYLHLSNSVNTVKEITVDIYNLKGRRILAASVSSMKPVCLSRLHAGVYLAYFSTGSGKLIRTFTLAH